MASEVSEFEKKVAENRTYLLAHCDQDGSGSVYLMDVVQNI